MANSPRILSTKKLTKPQQELLLNKGFALVHRDFIKIEYSDITETSINDAIIITSKNGVKGLQVNNLIDTIKTKQVYCVGSKTKQLLETLAINVTASFTNAKTLGDYIVANLSEISFTYFCGNIRRKELPELLHQHNITLQEVITYKTMFSPKRMDGTYDGILFFSPSLVESYFFNNSLTKATAFCIGKTTENTIKTYTKNYKTATVPTVENVIVQVVKHFNTTLQDDTK